MVTKRTRKDRKMARLHLDPVTCMIPATYPKTFFRVTDWNSGVYIADFDQEGEAVAFSYCTNTGKRFDDRVSTMRLTGR